MSGHNAPLAVGAPISGHRPTAGLGGATPPATCNGGRVAVWRPGPRQNNIQRFSGGHAPPYFQKEPAHNLFLNDFDVIPGVCAQPRGPNWPNKFPQDPKRGKWSYQLFGFGASRASNFWGSTKPIRRVSPSTGRLVYRHRHAETPRIRRPMCLIQKVLLVTHAAHPTSSTDSASYDVEAGLPPIEGVPPTTTRSV